MQVLCFIKKLSEENHQLSWWNKNAFTFAQLGRIMPIRGNFPTRPDEIAMTTTQLDALESLD